MTRSLSNTSHVALLIMMFSSCVERAQCSTERTLFLIDEYQQGGKEKELTSRAPMAVNPEMARQAASGDASLIGQHPAAGTVLYSENAPPTNVTAWPTCTCHIPKDLCNCQRTAIESERCQLSMQAAPAQACQQQKAALLMRCPVLVRAA